MLRAGFNVYAQHEDGHHQEVHGVVLEQIPSSVYSGCYTIFTTFGHHSQARAR